MPTFVVKALRGEPDPWSNEHGEFLTYGLDVESDGQSLIVGQNKRKDSPPPTVGEVIEGELIPAKNPIYPPKLKAYSKGSGGGSGGGGGWARDPKETAAIHRQHSQSVAVWLIQAKATAGLATAEDFTPAKLRFLTDYFEDDIQGHALNRPAPQEGPPATPQEAHGSDPLPAAPPPLSPGSDIGRARPTREFERTGRSDIPDPLAAA